jgi:hypothetical protein
VRLISEAILKRASRVLLAEVNVDRFGIAGRNERYRRITWNRIRLDAPEQAFQGLDAHVPVAVPKLGER